MATLRPVNTEFWADEYIAEQSRDAKLLFLYLLTNPLTNITGAYKIGRKKIKQDTDFTDAELDTLLSHFEKDGKVFYRDGWIFLPNFLKNQSFGGNLPKTAINQALETPDWAQAEIAKTIQESPKLTAVFLSVKDLVLCLKTKSGCLDSKSAHRKERKGKEEEVEVRAEDATAQAVHTGLILAGVAETLGLKKLSRTQEKAFEEAALLSFINGFSSEQFLAAYRDLKAKNSYHIKPEYVTDRLPNLYPKKKEAKPTMTARDFAREAEAQQAQGIQ